MSSLCSASDPKQYTHTEDAPHVCSADKCHLLLVFEVSYSSPTKPRRKISGCCECRKINVLTVYLSYLAVLLGTQSYKWSLV